MEGELYEHKKQDKPLEDIKVENETINLEELLASLISNNIDADRLDYIVRDSKKAGFNILTEVCQEVLGNMLKLKYNERAQRPSPTTIIYSKINYLIASFIDLT